MLFLFLHPISGDFSSAGRDGGRPVQLFQLRRQDGPLFFAGLPCPRDVISPVCPFVHPWGHLLDTGGIVSHFRIIVYGLFFAVYPYFSRIFPIINQIYPLLDNISPIVNFLVILGYIGILGGRGSKISLCPLRCPIPSPCTGQSLLRPSHLLQQLLGIVQLFLQIVIQVLFPLSAPQSGSNQRRHCPSPRPTLPRAGRKGSSAPPAHGPGSRGTAAPAPPPGPEECSSDTRGNPAPSLRGPAPP